MLPQKKIEDPKLGLQEVVETATEGSNDDVKKRGMLAYEILAFAFSNEDWSRRPE